MDTRQMQTTILPRPPTVEIGQVWSYRGIQGRPLVVIELKRQVGNCPLCFKNNQELWAVFRKGKSEVVHHMLDPRSTWHFHGNISQETPA